MESLGPAGNTLGAGCQKWPINLTWVQSFELTDSEGELMKWCWYGEWKAAPKYPRTSDVWQEGPLQVLFR